MEGFLFNNGDICTIFYKKIYDVNLSAYFFFNVNALLGNLYSNIKYKMGSQVGDMCCIACMTHPQLLLFLLPLPYLIVLLDCTICNWEQV